MPEQGATVPTHKNNARLLPQPAVPCKITTAQKRMINRSNRRTRRRHTKITPAPFSTCRSLQNHNRPKKDDKPIEPPYIPPTHKNNARPLPQPAAPCKITTAQKRMTNRSNRHTRRRHTKITPGPFLNLPSLAKSQPPKKGNLLYRTMPNLFLHSIFCFNLSHLF